MTCPEQSEVEVSRTELTVHSNNRGAKAHQSSEVKSHSNVLSVKFFEGDQRVISGHIHMNGAIEYSQRARNTDGQAGSSKSGWQPSRDKVDQKTWTIYDPESKKNRKVASEGEWWYIQKGAETMWF